MKRVLAVVVVMASLALCGSNIFAQQGGKKQAGAKPQASPAERFKQADKDGDGSLSADEFKATLHGAAAEKAKEIFELKDTNKDGKLSPQEFATMTFEEYALRNGVDPKVGKITLEDVKKANPKNSEMAERMFKMRDQNRDGVVTKEDFAQAKGKGAKGGKGGKRGKKAAG